MKYATHVLTAATVVALAILAGIEGRAQQPSQGLQNRKIQKYSDKLAAQKVDIDKLRAEVLSTEAKAKVALAKYKVSAKDMEAVRDWVNAEGRYQAGKGPQQQTAK